MNPDVVESNSINDNVSDPTSSKSASTTIGALSAGGRSVVYQLTSSYLRTPVKLFKPARFDYFHYVRVILTGDANNTAINNDSQSVKNKFWFKRFSNAHKYTSMVENSSLGLLTKALNKYGWRVIPDRVLPPLLVNSATGIVLYSTYLASLTALSKPHTNAEQYVTVFKLQDVFASGFLAGFAQSIISTPVDAIYTRSSTLEIFESIKKYNNLWIFALDKVKEIGLIGCFSGFTLVAIKESFGFAIYFTTFELIKGTLSNFILNLVNSFRKFKFKVKESFDFNSEPTSINETASKQASTTFLTVKEEKWVKRSFIFMGGISAALLLQLFQYPFTKIQKIHFSRLEAFDIYNRSFAKNSKVLQNNSLTFSNMILRHPKRSQFHIYYHSYFDTFTHIHFIHKTTGDLTRWLYKGFTNRAMTTIPGTTIGLILLDYMRSKLEDDIITSTNQMIMK
ncbi:hypothetical protein TPHA_0B03950 [Tetrapisispora phaffii CBS 4417]|uniref:Mitochondrial carrier protein n=1 Tax=Tetrapisispora phaffii (strain ATCC 24235 / CBS 4417 / NBRC 1672 / NRRL Y-8282 / UCD 70-5) TaxID=1071381 RepID=G8BPY6_TETPH|nr:hypothetical protein TPHA_0B03950 [Tetrapisispora phaffii CBS 4417]CCE62067.1 hypothetical protein TPHA_0B03950 [Tetrapisispora phaffii CBS 4417]